uniref:Transmembrane protein n=1 Tax=Setaria digitata TaxID=48799 RepID=A0A915Q8A5_9BILA
MAVNYERWQVVLTFLLLGLIPFAALTFFIAFYLGRTKGMQEIKMQKIQTDDKEEAVIGSAQSTQKSMSDMIMVEQHRDIQYESSDTFSADTEPVKNSMINKETTSTTASMCDIILKHPFQERGTEEDDDIHWKRKPTEFVNIILRKDEKNIGNSNIQMQSSYSTTRQVNPRTSFVKQGGKTRSGNQLSHQINSTSFGRSPTLTPETVLKDKGKIREILKGKAMRIALGVRIRPRLHGKIRVLMSSDGSRVLAGTV